MDTRDAIFLVFVFVFGNVLNVKADNGGTHFQMDVRYSGTYCSDITDVGDLVRSDINCANRCSNKQGCKGFFYNTITGKCNTMKSVPNITHECQVDQGSVYYKRQDCPVALVTGPHGIADSQITASSSYQSWGPQYGRLDDAETWIAGLKNQQQYIQYRFQGSKTVNSIITQGSPYASDDEWVTHYKVSYSANCGSFTTLSQTFTGNSDMNTKVTHNFVPPIVAMCVKVNPWAWSVWPAMRVELMGC